MQVRSRITVNLKLNMRFPINHFSIICRPLPCTARCVLSCDDITYFISASVAVDRHFNEASKKENILREYLYIFSSNIFEITTPPPLAYNTDKNNQPLKLLFVTVAADLVLQLELWVRKCSSLIFIIISNTLLYNFCRWDAYFAPSPVSMMVLLFELRAKSC